MYDMLPKSLKMQISLKGYEVPVASRQKSLVSREEECLTSYISNVLTSTRFTYSVAHIFEQNGIILGIEVDL